MARNLGLAVSLLITPFLAAGAQERLPFSDGRWDLRGDSTAIDTVGGRESVRMMTGYAYRRDVKLVDGTIDLDVMMSHRRSFVFVSFRMQSDDEYEDFYLRPHKSGLPDAVQYAPVWQGQGSWQLHHGPGGTAAVTFPVDTWTRLRVVVSGERAALFVGDTVRPVLITRLTRPPRAGYLALGGFLPAGSMGAGYAARFSDVRVRVGVVSYAFADTTPARPVLSGIVDTWRVGQSFAPPDSGVSTLVGLPERAVSRNGIIRADATGLVAFHPSVRLPTPGRNSAGIVASLLITAESAGPRRFELGFSDIATVFLNGRPLARLDASYSYAGRREGVIGFNQSTLFLPLERGPNELTVVVTDSFGGWGLMGRFPDMRGLRVSP
jgi:hypothetical protein